MYKPNKSLFDMQDWRICVFYGSMSVFASVADDGSTPPLAQSTPIGFSAYEDAIVPYASGDTIVFPHIITNVGGHYSTVTSAFTCPYSGFYLFSVNVMSDDDEHLRAQIMQNGVLLATAYADDLPTSVHTTYHQATMTVVTECAAGDRVWIEAEDAGEIHGDGSRVSAFTGVMINQYSNATVV